MHHVVFVDDEPAVLAGVRRMLHSMRDQWRMTFVASGPAAIQAMTADPADIVISDMRMPVMDGAELLTVVQRRWPGAVRMILSGYAEQGAALRSIAVAHRFLNKPCDREQLVDTVRDACQLQDRLSRPELRQLLGGLGTLPSPPASYTAITEELGRDEPCPRTVTSIIENDPGCTAKLLQLVNSAFFGRARSITNVADAVACLGLRSVRDVVLGAEIAELFRFESPALAAAATAIYAHCAAVADAAHDLAPQQYAQDAFAAGLLHDVGLLALVTTAPQQYLALVQDHRDGVDIAQAERDRFGATHAEVGGYLLRLWGLPFSLVDSVTRHHDPDALNDEDPVIAAVAAAATRLQVWNA